MRLPNLLGKMVALDIHTRDGGEVLTGRVVEQDLMAVWVDPGDGSKINVWASTIEDYEIR